MKKIRNIMSNFTNCIKIIFKISPPAFIIQFLSKMALPINGIIMAYLMKCILNFLVYDMPERQYKKIILFLFFYFFIKIMDVTLRSVTDLAEEIENMRLQKYIGDRIVESCTKLDIEMFDDVESYNEIQFVQNNYNSISSIVWRFLEITASVISFIIICIVASKRMYLYAIVIILACIPAGISKISYTKKFYSLTVGQLSDERRTDYMLSLVTSKYYAQEIRLYDLKNYIQEKYDFVWRRLFNERKGVLQNSCRNSIFLLILPEVSFFLIMLHVTKSIIRGTMLIGDYSLYLAVITQIWGGITRIIYNIDSIDRENYKVNFFMDFLKRKSNIPDGDMNIKQIERIEFIDAYFKYPFSNEYTLKGLDMKINNGDKIAIVGENGAGKSTIIKLLLRYYDLDSGQILINGYDIKKYRIEELRSCFGLYFQNGENYAFTLKENIIISDLGKHEDSGIEDAIRISGIQKIINEKRLKMDSYISKLFDEDGVELSGGQNQKLALCRTIYRNSQILIFDEPSAALDPKAEHDFFENVRKMTYKKTVIYISHRLSNINMSDNIIVIDDGRKKEEGTLEELLKNKNKFFELYNYQQSFL